MLRLENVSKTYTEAGDYEVLKSISFSIPEGEFVCILGPSGCGKSVLLYLIAGFLQPSDGLITMDGEQIVKPDRSRILMFQNNVLFPWKTVFGNVLFGLEKTSMPQAEKEELVLYYLNLVGLIQFKDWYTNKLSGGMQQRVALARSLVANPNILLMDEPFSALDIQYRRYFRKTLEDIWMKTKKTIVLVTHDVHEAVHLADKIYVLSAHPARVKSIYDIKLSRPRKFVSADSRIYSEYVRKIKRDLIEEFEKTGLRPEIEEKYLLDNTI